MVSFSSKIAVGATALSIFLVNPVFASPKLNCTSDKAIYAPPSSSASGLKTTLTVSNIPGVPAGGAPTAKLILTTRRLEGEVTLSQLTLEYGCSGEGDYCVAGFIASPEGAKERARSFPVVGLNRDFSPNHGHVSSPRPDAKDAAPYALILANFAEAVAHTDWHANPTSIEYFTTEKIAPQASDVWVLQSCDSH